MRLTGHPFRQFARTVNAGRSRFYARGGRAAAEQIAPGSHDADLAVRDLDAPSERPQIAAISAAVDPDPRVGSPGELS